MANSNNANCCSQCLFKAREEWKVTNHETQKHHICPFKSCRTKNPTAAALASHLHDNHHKTRESAKLTAGVIKVIDCRRCEDRQTFTNERSWNRHCVEKHGSCPMMHCTSSCSDPQSLCAHLVKVHRKSTLQARKMCFLRDDPVVSKGFMVSVGKSNPITRMLRGEKEASKRAAPANTEVNCDLLDTAETSRAEHFKNIAKKKMNVATLIKNHSRSTMDPTKNMASLSLAKLEKILEKLNSE